MMVRTKSANYDALAWVKDDLEQSLESALQFITEYIDTPIESSPLLNCIEQLNQVLGTVDMLNLSGATLLSEELLSSLKLLAQTSNDETTASSSDAVLKGVLVLTNYLSLIGPELEDHPLHIIETVNELRKSTSQSTIDPIELLDISVDIPLTESLTNQAYTGKINGLNIENVNHAFQLSFLSWLKNDDVNGLKKVYRVIQYLHQNTTLEHIKLLWTIAESYIEELISGAIFIGTDTKLLLGKLAQPIKLFTKFNEATLIEQFPTTTIKALLLNLAKSTSDNPKRVALIELFDLEFLNQLHHQQIYSFGDNALSEAHKAIIEQLQEIKEDIDQLSRQNSFSDNEIAALTNQFESIANTLDLLSEDQASTQLRLQLEKLAQLDGAASSYKDDLLDIANVLLNVESLLQPNHSTESSNTPDLQKVVITECLNELITIKDALSRLSSDAQDEQTNNALKETAAQTELIASSIMMLNLAEATSLLENTAQFMVNHSANYTDHDLNICAEVISATELYLEGLIQHGQKRSELLIDASLKLGLTPYRDLSLDEPELIYSEQLDNASNLVTLKEKSNTLNTENLASTPIELELLDEGNQFQPKTNRPELNTKPFQDPIKASSDAPIDFTLHSELSPNITDKDDVISDDIEPINPTLDEDPLPLKVLDIDTETTHDELHLDEAFSTSSEPVVVKTSVQRYIDSLSNNADVPPLELTIKTPSSVQRYIDRLSAQGSVDLTQALTIEPLKTSVQRYIDNLIETDLSLELNDDELALAPIELVKTSVQDYIDRHAESGSDTIEVMELDVGFADGIDNEIAEIFIEEANEVLEQLSELIPNWLQTHDNNTLQAIRRHFHTLKGSGRMAGAGIIGELAWSVESTLNAILEHKQSPNNDVEQLVQESFTLIPNLVTRFAHGEMASTESVEKMTLLASNIQSDKADPTVLMSEEDELQAIFNSEAHQHITTFNEALSSQSYTFTISNELLRASHSLKGCAAIAQVTPVAIIAAELDLVLRQCYEVSNQLDTEQRELLALTIEGISALIQHHQGHNIDEPDLRQLSDYLTQIKPVGQSSSNVDPELLAVLVDETNELLEQFHHELNQLRSEPTNQLYQHAICEILDKLKESANNANIEALQTVYTQLELVAQHIYQNNISIDFTLLDDGYEEMNLNVEAVMQNQSAPDLTAFIDRVQHFITPPIDSSLSSPQDSVLDVQELPESTSNQNALNSDQPLFIIPSHDEDLLEAFTEECAELLESSGQAIKQWQSDYFNQNASMQLQRDLHTIKGGARLTDIDPIADLTHQTESLVLSAVESHSVLNNEFFNLLQRCQDSMADMQVLLSQRQPLPFATALLTEVATFLGQTHDAAPPENIIEAPTHDPVVTVETNHTEPKAIPNQTEHVRVRTDLLDFLTNFAGEVNISRDRVSQHNLAIHQQLGEMESTIERLQDQLRNLEIETETQILFRYENDASLKNADFDPLELDRFSKIQQLSRGLTESVSDLNDITGSLSDLVRDSDTILLQQSRLSTGIHQGLMNTKLLPFKGLIPRLERIVRQTNDIVGKESELIVTGEHQELDRTALDKIVAPIEHIIRNAIAHGIETPEQRVANGKSASGTISLAIQREGSEVLLTISDDGQGINVEKIKQKALQLNLIDPDNIPEDDQLIQLILTSGFSTADDISQLSGRGVGMDVVHNEIRALKGRLSIKSLDGQGTTFIIRLPLTLSIMRSLLIATNEQQYAVPLAAVHTAERISVNDVRQLLTQQEQQIFEFSGEQYQFYALAELLDQPLILSEDPNFQLPLLLFRYGEKRIAVLIDAINSNREIVLKPAGPQLGNISAINGATILGDGQVVFVLDIPELVEGLEKSSGEIKITSHKKLDRVQTAQHSVSVLVVDDSITMRKATSNLLKRYGFEIVTAKDGIDAIAKLEEITPDIILLDVEMPRMDGFEFATFVRSDAQTQSLPIIMITSRTGDKHRQRAHNIGVNDYMGKPFQEIELINSIQNLLGNRVELIKE